MATARGKLSRSSSVGGSDASVTSVSGRKAGVDLDEVVSCSVLGPDLGAPVGRTGDRVAVQRWSGGIFEGITNSITYHGSFVRFRAFIVHFTINLNTFLKHLFGIVPGTAGI